jgi:hypothetical protein
MSWRPEDTNWKPNPEQLAAYGDGELDRCGAGAPLKRRIEEWLVDNPEAAGDLAAQRRLDRLCQATLASAPPEAAWDKVWTAIKEAPQNLPAPRSKWAARRVIWAAALLVTAAAAVLLAVTATLRTTDRNEPFPEEIEPFPVASAEEIDVFRIEGADTQTLAVSHLFDDKEFPVASSEEIEILRVNGADTDALVVGEPPVRGPLDLAKAGEVKVVSMDPARKDNMVPDARMGETPPMIWMPLDSAAIDK